MSQRLFIGLPLPQTYQQGLEALREEWAPRLRSRLSWTRPGNWHLTLAFLGDTPSAEAERVRQALEAVHSAPFTLQAAGGGAFPPGKKPRVLWVGLQHGRQESAALADQIWSVLAPLGIQPPGRPFRAHLTLARVKQERGDRWEALFRSLGEKQWPSCQIAEFVLWQSELAPKGPVYTAVQRYALRDCNASGASP